MICLFSDLRPEVLSFKPLHINTNIYDWKLRDHVWQIRYEVFYSTVSVRV